MSNTKNSYQTFLLKYLIIGIVFLCSCASVAGYTKFYPGPEKSLSEIAILTEPNPYLRELVILKIDNSDAPFGGLVELLPGHHKITALYYESSGYYKTTGTASVEFDAKAGHVYEKFPVFHTHDNGWYIGIWDVTDELHRPEKQKLSQKIDEILKKNRMTSTSISVIIKNIPGKTMGKLPGFGEKIKAQIIGMKGKQVDVEYKFNRYKPYILVEGSDGKDYHLKISQLNGSVEQVLGNRVKVGDSKQIYPAFQPINSDTAYVYSPKSGDVINIYKEMPNGSYIRIK